MLVRANRSETHGQGISPVLKPPNLSQFNISSQLMSTRQRTTLSSNLSTPLGLPSACINLSRISLIFSPRVTSRATGGRGISFVSGRGRWRDEQEGPRACRGRRESEAWGELGRPHAWVMVGFAKWARRVKGADSERLAKGESESWEGFLQGD